MKKRKQVDKGTRSGKLKSAAEEAPCLIEKRYRSLPEMLRLMCDNVPDMIWAKDLENRYIFTNRAICKNLLNAKDTDEPIGKTDMFFAERERESHPDDPQWHTFGEIYRDSDTIVMESGQAQRFDEYGNVKGKFLFLEVHKSPFFDEQGNMIGTVGCGRDITAHKLIEEELRESEERFRSLSEAAFETIAIHEEGVLFNANDQFFKMFGYEPSEIIGKQVMPMIVAPEAREFMTKQITTGEIGPYESIGLRKDGKKFSMEIRARQIQYKRRNARVGTIVDITERKVMEEKLRETEKLYRILTEETIAGVYLVQDGLFKYVNPTFCKISGYTKDELIDKFGPLDLVVEEEKEFLNDKIQQQLAEEKESDQFTIRAKKKGGEIRFIEVFGAYAHYTGKPVLLGACIDITESRKVDESIKKSQEELQALTSHLQNIREEERIRIAREIHDELGQSLTGIKIDISWLKKKLSDTVKPTDPIQVKIDSLLRLTESVIATTREISLNLRPGILDDLGLVAAMNWQIKRFSEQTEIICTFQSDVANITIPEDYVTPLFRICQECLTNITRHAHATEAKITLTREGRNLVLEIEDNGKGISTGQIRSSISLGILGMRERVVSLRGRFSISGEPGIGTRIKAELPLK